MRALLAAALLAALCNAQDETEPTEIEDTTETGETGEPEAAGAGGETHGGDHTYSYKENGADWGSYESFCDIGKEQSPVDLNEGAVSNDKMEINGYGYMNYPDGKFMTLTSHSLQMDFTDGEFQLTFPDGSMSLFEPLQLHFHSPSEHTVEGKHHDLEMHIVH